MTRLAQRHVAPFLAGILAAGFLVAAVDAAGVMPLSGILAQAPGDPAGAGGSPANPTPLSELDLDELVLEPSRFDFESVRVDLDFVGDFQGLYEWAPEPVTPANVAVDLELVVTDPVDPDGDGPVVTAEHAAASYLLSDDCNALSALPIRRQAKLRVLARILRPDEATIAALQRQAATPPAEDSAPVATALLSLALGGIVVEFADVRVVYLGGGLLLFAAAAIGFTAPMTPMGVARRPSPSEQ